MTESTWLISYLVYVLFGAILKKNTNKKLVLAAALSVAQISIGMHIGISCFLSVFFVVFALTLVAFTRQLKKAAEPGKNFHNAQSLQENLVRSAAYQSARTIVRSHIKKVE